MKLSWYAFLCLGVVMGCADGQEHDDEAAQQALGPRRPGPRRRIDSGSPVGVLCDAPDAGAADSGKSTVPPDSRASDAAVPDASVDERCDVVLSVQTYDGGAEAVLSATSGAVSLRLWAENRSSQPQSFSYTDPCYGAEFTGLGSYEPRRTCLAGACRPNLPRRELKLAPGQRQLIGAGWVDANPDPCNKSGLAAGAYEVGLILREVEGATLCEVPFGLTVR